MQACERVVLGQVVGTQPRPKSCSGVFTRNCTGQEGREGRGARMSLTAESEGQEDLGSPR